MEEKIEIRSFCGAATLLAVIEGVEPDKVKARFGLPTKKPMCLNCGEPALNNAGHLAKNPEGLCSKCWHKSRYILVACSQCGALKERLASRMITLTSMRGYQHFFCNNYCLGKWAGEHYGFKFHPELARRGPHKRKWDYDMVWQKHQETGWGYLRLSRLLNIPRASIARILAEKREAMKAEGGKG